MMRGVIVEAALYGQGDVASGSEPERVIAFLELDAGALHIRRAYGARSAILSVELEDLEAALTALKMEQLRRPVPGVDVPDSSEAT